VPRRKHLLGELVLGGRSRVLGGDPGIVWGLAYVRSPSVIAIADDDLTVGGDVLSADVGTDALFTYVVLGLGFRDRHPGRDAGDGSNTNRGRQGCRNVFHDQEYAPLADTVLDRLKS
jgi:hypothetical protein